MVGKEMKKEEERTNPDAELVGNGVPSEFSLLGPARHSIRDIFVMICTNEVDLPGILHFCALTLTFSSLSRGSRSALAITGEPESAIWLHIDFRSNF